MAWQSHRLRFSARYRPPGRFKTTTPIDLASVGKIERICGIANTRLLAQKMAAKLSSLSIGLEASCR
jgi:hypothetical protein